MNTNDKKDLLVIEAVGIMEKEMKKKEAPTNIRKKVSKELHYSERHLDRIFKEIMGCSLAEYAKDLYYGHAYKNWKNEKRKLTQRETYEGVRYFSVYFKRRFGFSLEEAAQKGETEMETKMTQEELLKIKEYLDESRLINSYELEEGNVRVEVDIDLFLLSALSYRAYIVPEKFIKETNWEELSLDGQKLLLIIVDKAGTNLEKKKITIPVDEMEREYEVLDIYDFENPALLNGNYIYSVRLDDNLKSIFVRIIDACLHLLSITFPNGPETPLQYIEIMEAFDKCRGFFTIRRLAEKSGRTENWVIDILWEMAQKGILRIVDDCISPIPEK